MADQGKNAVLGTIVGAVVVAILVGGSAPWWWQEFFEKDRPTNDAEVDSTASTTQGSITHELDLVGRPRFDFLGSGAGVGPPRYRLGRYAFLCDVRVANHSDEQLFVRHVRVTLRNPNGIFAEGEQELGSLDRWKIAPGQSDLLELQVRMDILQDPERFKTRFEQRPGQPNPRFEFTLHGSVAFEILKVTGDLETKTFPLERFDVLIQPLGP